jgi:hypothetical protein
VGREEEGEEKEGPKGGGEGGKEGGGEERVVAKRGGEEGKEREGEATKEAGRRSFVAAVDKASPPPPPPPVTSVERGGRCRPLRLRRA